MKKIIILLAIIFFANIQTTFAQSKLENIPFFGNIPFVQSGNSYALDFGKLGKFNFTGTVNPLALTATVGMDDLKTFPGAKVMSTLGFQDIEMTIAKKGLGIAANFDDKFKDDIVDEVKKIKLLAPVVGTIMNTIEIRQSQASLFFNTAGKLEGKLDINIYLFGQRLPIPKIQGEINIASILKKIIDKIKDEGLGKIAKIGEVIKDAGAAAGAAVGKSAEIVTKFVELGKTKASHVHPLDGGEKYCRKKCIPNRASRLAGRVLPASIYSLKAFHENIIMDLVYIEGETFEETVRLREEQFLAEWNKLNRKIESDWNNIRNDKEYVGYFLDKKWAEDGGRKFRTHIDNWKKEYLDYKKAIHSSLVSSTFWEIPEKTFFIQSAMNYDKDNGGYWDLPGRPEVINKGMNVEVYKIDYGKDQKFTPVLQKDGYYSIHVGEVQSLFGGKANFNKFLKSKLPVVEIAGGKSNMKKNGANIGVWESNKGDWQKFKFMHLGGGKFKIYNKSGLAICLAGRKNANGTNINVWEDHDGAWLEWYLIDPRTRKVCMPTKRERRVSEYEKVLNKEVWIQSAMNYKKNNGGYWDIPGSPESGEDGQNIHCWSIDNGPDRIFKFVPSFKYEGYYQIYSAFTGYCLDNKGGDKNLRKNGNNILLWTQHGESSQVFKLKHLGNGKFKIYNKEGHVICLSGRKNANGTNINIWEDQNGPWMEWYFIDAKSRTAIIP